MYTPSDDSYLLADCIRQYKGMRALEIGIGSGLLLSILEENFTYVAGSDIDLLALQHCRQHRISSNALLVCCDAASAFGIGKFDLIVSNPPYLPNDDFYHIRDPTVHGGPSGVETTVHFINSALPLLAGDGKMLIVISSFANAGALDNVVVENKMRKKVVKEKRLFYEMLSIVELSI